TTCATPRWPGKGNASATSPERARRLPRVPLSYDAPRPDRREDPMTFARTLLALSLLAASACAAAVDARERGFIRQGMAEGEVLLKIGKPDHEAFVRDVKGQPEEKTWTYFPDSRDPQTLTIITFRGGVVSNIERKISR